MWKKLNLYVKGRYFSLYIIIYKKLLFLSLSLKIERKREINEFFIMKILI